MTDLELTRLAAEAMGLPVGNGGTAVWNGKVQINAKGFFEDYDPLHDDAQAMALVKRFKLHIRHNGIAWLVDCAADRLTGTIIDVDLCRAIVTCVSKMQAAKASHG